MAVEITTEILINANPGKVWQTLTNFSDYSKWNPFITLLEGDLKVGNKIKVRIEPPGASVNTFEPKVLTVKTNEEISWIGTLLFTGIFDGHHKLQLTDNKNGTTTFKQSEKFTGILVPFFKKQLENNTKDGFHAMNEKLKEIVENK